MSFDVTEFFSQVVVSLILIGGSWLFKLRRDVSAAHRKIRSQQGEIDGLSKELNHHLFHVKHEV